MIKNHNKFLHDRELAVMRLVWERGEVTDSEVQPNLPPSENLDTASVAAIVRELVQNGVLTGREEDRTYVYTPLVSKREVESAELKDMLDGIFDGSVAKMLAAMVELRIVSPDEIKSAAGSL